jgi:hypothetical protein
VRGEGAPALELRALRLGADAFADVIPEHDVAGRDLELLGQRAGRRLRRAAGGACGTGR